jgi:hypothetical protein
MSSVCWTPITGLLRVAWFNGEMIVSEHEGLLRRKPTVQSR